MMEPGYKSYIYERLKQDGHEIVFHYNALPADRRADFRANEKTVWRTMQKNGMDQIKEREMENEDNNCANKLLSAF